jgi:hypothetical protein
VPSKQSGAKSSLLPVAKGLSITNVRWPVRTAWREFIAKDGVHELIVDLAILDRALSHSSLESVARLFEHARRSHSPGERHGVDPTQSFVSTEGESRHGCHGGRDEARAPMGRSKPIPDLSRDPLDVLMKRVSIPPTASPSTVIAKNVTGFIASATAMNASASAVYGCGNRSRRLRQMQRSSVKS